MTTAFGDILREWRTIRRFSQLQLSLEAEISARHVSFLESGRAQPSRSMVIKLAEALEMPKETANHAMHAAGFAPVFPQLPLDADALSPVRSAVSLMLANHDPLPGVAIDRHWDIIDANRAAMDLFSELGVTGAGNMIDALVAASESNVIENWEETALLALARMRAEIVHLGGDRTLERFANQIANHPRLADIDASAVNYGQAVISSVFNLSGGQLSLFTTLAQFGTVQDVVASDIRIELMFPADKETTEYFQSKLN